MNLNQIKEIISLMNENNLSEIEIEKEGMKIRIKKSSGTSEPSIEPAGRGPLLQTVAEPVSTPATDKAMIQEKDRPEESTGKVVVKSPMVGTFFRAPAPDAPPFVEKGKKVEAGQVLCLIEAMKLMNEIKAEVSGIVKEILVENGEPVEFGQELFILETT